jgi:hypothetical protein
MIAKAPGCLQPLERGGDVLEADFQPLEPSADVVQNAEIPFGQMMRDAGSVLRRVHDSFSAAARRVQSPTFQLNDGMVQIDMVVNRAAICAAFDRLVELCRL